MNFSSVYVYEICRTAVNSQSGVKTPFGGIITGQCMSLYHNICICFIAFGTSLSKAENLTRLYELSERIWSHTQSFEDPKNLRSATNRYHAAIIKAKRTYIILLSFHPAPLILVNFGKSKYVSINVFTRNVNKIC